MIEAQLIISLFWINWPFYANKRTTISANGATQKYAFYLALMNRTNQIVVASGPVAVVKFKILLQEHENDN